MQIIRGQDGDEVAWRLLKDFQDAVCRPETHSFNVKAEDNLLFSLHGCDEGAVLQFADFFNPDGAGGTFRFQEHEVDIGLVGNLAAGGAFAGEETAFARAVNEFSEGVCEGFLPQTGGTVQNHGVRESSRFHKPLRQPLQDVMTGNTFKLMFMPFHLPMSPVFIKPSLPIDHASPPVKYES